jgi:hypothetical protein
MLERTFQVTLAMVIVMVEIITQKHADMTVEIAGLELIPYK